MGGLLAVAWRGIARRKARSALTAVAVMLGVANVFGVLIVNDSIDRGVKSQTDSWGEADAAAYPTQAEDANTPIILTSLPRLRRLADIEDLGLAWGALVMEAPKPLHGRIIISARDRLENDRYLNPRLVRGRTPSPGRPEVVLTERVADALKKNVGDTVSSDLRRLAQGTVASTPLRLTDDRTRRVHLRVTGIVRDRPFDDEIMVTFTSIEYIWRLFEPDVANEVTFYLADGVDPAAWVAEVESEFPDLRFYSSATAPELARFVQTIQTLLSGTSALALFVGAFLIYLTFSIAVVERTRLYGSLHAIGARGRHVASAVLFEASLLGVVATVIGIAVGLGLSVGLVRLVTRVVPAPVRSPAITPRALAAGIGVGLAATLVGVAVPAIRAARMTPVAAIRGTASARPRVSRAWILGAALLAAGMAYGATAQLGADSASTLAAISVLAGSVLIVPPLLGPLALGLRRAAGRISPGLSTVAVGHVTRERSRSAYTLALVMVVLAAMVTMGATDRSFSNVLDRWLDKRFGADLLLYGPAIDDDLRRRIEDVKGVGPTTGLDFTGRVAITAPERESHNLILIDPDSFFTIAGFPWAQGSDEEARRAMERGGSVLLPSAVGGRLGVDVGDRVELAIGGRGRGFDVAGLYATFGTGPEVGVVASFADRRFFEPDDTRDVIYMNFDGDGSVRSVTAALQPILDPETDNEDPVRIGDPPEFGRPIGRYFAISGAEIKQRARGELDAFVRVFLAVVLIAAIVGILGMANTLAASVLLRFREIGVLQAVGARPAVVRRMIIAESFLLTAVAFLLALALGAVMTWMFNTGASAVGGFTVPIAYPWELVPLFAVAAGAIAYLAALVPARRAARLTPVEALRYE